MNAWLRNRRDCASRTLAKLFAIYNERRFCSADACRSVSREGPRSATMADSNEVVIIAGCRTPIGKFQGSLSDMSAPQLGAVAVRGALELPQLLPQQSDEWLMGNDVSARHGPKPRRAAAPV